MSTLFPASSAPMPAHSLHPGQAIHVNNLSVWVAAQVTSITHTRIGVAYTRRPLPRLATGVPPWLVRPAEGIQLRLVSKLRYDDDLVSSDEHLHKIIGAHPAGHRWIIEFHDGTHTPVPCNAILRIKDPTPQVTLNGIPLP